MNINTKNSFSYVGGGSYQYTNDKGGIYVQIVMERIRIRYDKTDERTGHDAPMYSTCYVVWLWPVAFFL